MKICGILRGLRFTFIIVIDMQGGMSRPLRIDYPNAWHHVMNCARRGTDLFFRKKIDKEIPAAKGQKV